MLLGIVTEFKILAVTCDNNSSNNDTFIQAFLGGGHLRNPEAYIQCFAQEVCGGNTTISVAFPWYNLLLDHIEATEKDCPVFTQVIPILYTEFGEFAKFT